MQHSKHQNFTVKKLIIMGIFSESTESRLNELLERTYDAEKGFDSASELVDSDYLKNYFRKKAQERLKYRTELRKEILDNGCEIREESGSVKAGVHRNWMDLRSYLTSNKSEAVMDEVKRGEKAAVEDYNKILEDPNLPPTTEKLLKLQRDEIKENYNKVENIDTVG